MRNHLRAGLLAALVSTPALFSPLFGDDFIHIERAGALLNGQFSILLEGWLLGAADAGAWWTPPELLVPYFRPVVALSFALDRWIWGLMPFGYHLTNLGLHALATGLFSVLAWRLLGTKGQVAATLFALHPAHTEAVTWASGRTDLLAGVGILTAFLAPGPLTAALAAFFTLGAKELAVVIGPGLLLLDKLTRPGPRWWTRGAAASAATALGWGLRVMAGVSGMPPHPFAHGPGDPDALPHALSAAAIDLVDLVLTAPVDPVVGLPLLLQFWPIFLLLTAVSAGILALGWHRAAGRVEALFALLWMGLSLIPVLPISVGERFLYAPSFGLCLLAGAALPLVLGPRWRRFLAGLGIFSFLKVSGWGLFAFQAGRPIQAALNALDAAPSARCLLLLDLPAASALGFGHALRLMRPEREVHLEILTLSPHFLGRDPRFSARVLALPGAIQTTATGSPYLSSYIERAFRGEAGPLTLGERIERPCVSVQVDGVSPEGVTSLTFTPASGAALLRWDVQDPEPLQVFP